MASKQNQPQFQPNEEYLKALIEMGVTEKKAIKALKFVNNESVDTAAMYLFENLIDSNDEDDDDDEYLDDSQMSKMVFVINCALNMQTGKIAAQCAHAAIDLFQKAQLNDQSQNDLSLWQQYGQTKIVLKGDNEAQLLELNSLATKSNANLTATLIYDAGRTEVASGSLTCFGLFGRVIEVDKITGSLKLLK